MHRYDNDAKQRIFVETGESASLAKLAEVFIESGSTSNRAAIEQELKSLYESLPTRQ